MDPDRMRLLKTCRIFKDLSSLDLEKLAGISHRKKLVKDELLFHEGEEADRLYFVTAGRMKLYKLNPDGREQILRFVRPGEMFAEAAVFAGGTYPVNAGTMADTELLYFYKGQFITLLTGNVDLVLGVIGTLAGLQRHLATLVEELSLGDVSARIAKYLLDLSLRERSHELVLDVPKTSLAMRLGTVPETLSRNFRKLQDSGIITIKGPNVRILSPEGLQMAASGIKG